MRKLIVEHMDFGDSRAAVVVGVDPILVAAYTDELDCVAMLRFPSQAGGTPLEIGSRLLTVNTYYRQGHDPDLHPGPGSKGRYGRLYPIIADFICADQGRVEKRKSEIDSAEWERATILGHAYRSAHPDAWRSGAPSQSHWLWVPKPKRPGLSTHWDPPSKEARGWPIPGREI
jgi:hypothetical protein